ncbi:MAG: sulfur carrier protein ThiS [Desulfobacterales bacterium]|nr:sulfur carrier protein ThiS [Desulfobacterales bacterium]
MKITINGEKQEVEGSVRSIAELLAFNKVESPDMVSVQLNGKIVDRSQYETVLISENDEIDFLYFMGGGAA